MLEFAWPWAFALLPLPMLIWRWLPPYRARQASVQVPFFERLAAATGQTPQPGAVVRRRRAVQMVVAILAWILIVAALARPQWVGDPLTREVSARDLILAVDISGSMDQRDFRAADGADADAARRRQARHQGFHRAPPRRPRRTDPVRHQGLCAGALHAGPGDGRSNCSNRPQVGMAGQQTAIGDTIGLAIKTMEKSTAKQKLLILLTDGNDTASRVPPEHAADIAQQNGVVVYTIGVGDPAASGENRVDLERAASESPSTTGGQFFRAEDGARARRQSTPRSTSSRPQSSTPCRGARSFRCSSGRSAPPSCWCCRCGWFCLRSELRPAGGARHA